MDAVEFLEEQYRMCEALNSHCEECGLSYTNNKTDHVCGDFIKRHPEEAVAIVAKWAKDHPRKTRQSEFLKMFPRGKLASDGMLKFCPQEVDSGFMCPMVVKRSLGIHCEDCRREYWLAEVEE